MALIQDVVPPDKRPIHHLYPNRATPPFTMEAVKRLRHRPNRRPPDLARRRQTLTSASSPAIPSRRDQPTVRAKILKYYKYPVFMIGTLVAIVNLTTGQAVISLYFVLTIVFNKTVSRISFFLTLVSLICIPLFDAIGQSGISDNAAIYAFELLLVGVVQSVIAAQRGR